MNDYSKKGIIFFNEAHFQSEFAIFLSKTIPMSDYEIILEYSPKFKKYRVDLLIKNKRTNERTIIEFKYVVKEALVEVSKGFYINLKNQLAYDVRRYQIWRDISKLEDLIANGKCEHGYFVMITNADDLIKPVNPKNIDSEFDISSGLKRPNNTSLYWSYYKEKTWKRYPKHVHIKKTKSYEFNYKSYSKATGMLDFKYLILPIQE